MARLALQERRPRGRLEALPRDPVEHSLWKEGGHLPQDRDLLDGGRAQRRGREHGRQRGEDGHAEGRRGGDAAPRPGYLSQRDTGSAERLLRAFRTRFPRSSRKAEIAEIEARIAFEKGEHAQGAGYTGSAEPELMVMRAESVYKSGRAKEAAALFGKAALG